MLPTFWDNQSVPFSRAKKSKKNLFFESLTPEDGTDRLSRNVGNYQSTLCNMQEERPSHIRRKGRSKSRRFMFRSWYRSMFQAISVWYVLSFRVMRARALNNNNNNYLRFSISFATHSVRNWEHANLKRLRKAKFISCTALHRATSI
jgi:hypothetical protein